MVKYINAEHLSAKIGAGILVKTKFVDVLKEIDNIPPADVRENVRGEWILSGGYFRCSICNEKALLKLDKSKGGSREYEQQKTNFCPYCGAKMEKKGETS